MHCGQKFTYSSDAVLGIVCFQGMDDLISLGQLIELVEAQPAPYDKADFSIVLLGTRMLYILVVWGSG